MTPPASQHRPRILPSTERLQKRPFGVVLFGLGLIVTSLLQSTALVDRHRYWYLFSDLPTSAITIRYALSWIARIVGLASGVGILLRRELFRRVTIALAALTIMTVYWKHSYEGFLRHVQDLQQRSPAVAHIFQILQQGGVEVSEVTRIAVIVIRLQEIALALLLIWYFTRPRVKDWFGPHPSH